MAVRFRTILLLLIVESFGVQAQLSVGVNASYRLQSTIITSSDALPQSSHSTRSTAVLSIAPTVGIALGSFITIAPLVEWSLLSTTVVEDDPIMSDEMTVTQNQIAVGCELLATVLRFQNVSFSLGPQVGYRYHVRPEVTTTAFSLIDTGAYDFSSYYAHDIWLGFPLCADIFVNRRVAIRLSAKIINVQYSYVRYTRPRDILPFESHDFDVSFTTLFQPSAGFFVVF